MLLHPWIELISSAWIIQAHRVGAMRFSLLGYEYKSSIALQCFLFFTYLIPFVLVLLFLVLRLVLLLLLLFRSIPI